MTHSEMLKDARKFAKELGLTLKSDNCYINGNKAYKIIKRDSGLTYLGMDRMTLAMAYETLLAM